MNVMPSLSDAAIARPVAPASAILAAAQTLLPRLERGRPIDTDLLRGAMEASFGASDAAGAWDWKDAYEAGEVATVLFLQKFGRALFRSAQSPVARLAALEKIAALLPTHTRRSEEGRALQQFSTPIPLGLAAVTAAAIVPGDVVLEPSAGTGLLAVLAEIAGGRLLLNELAETRADLLASLFLSARVTRFDAAQIDDHLGPDAVPTVVVMNPPFSALAQVSGRVADAGLRHVTSALARLAPGGWLVAITGANVGPEAPEWREAFVRLQERSRLVFTAAVAGAVFARHGTVVPTRLTVIDKVPADDPTVLPASAGMAPDVATLMTWIGPGVPPRQRIEAPPTRVPRHSIVGTLVLKPRPIALRLRPSAPVSSEPQGVELSYETVDWMPPEGARLTDAIYEDYALQSIRIPGAAPHPTRLVQSAAMASVAPPKPSHRPKLPADICDRLSEAQLETVIYAGEAHTGHLAGRWTVDGTWDVVKAAPVEAEGAVRFRRGFMLGDGTGAGKGRQSARIILDNWLQGRRKAVWISKSDKLIEDAQRDWAALGQERLLVTPLSRFSQGWPITLTEGILFTTYATLRSEDRGDKASRVRQIVDWLGSTFDGVIVFEPPRVCRRPQLLRGWGYDEQDDEQVLGRGARSGGAAGAGSRA